MSIEISLGRLSLDSIDELTPESLKRSFKAGVILCHPDKGGQEGDFDRLLSAYLHLSSVLKRLSGGRDGLQSVLAVDEVEKAREAQFQSEMNNIINDVYDSIDSQGDAEFHNKFNEMFEKHHERDNQKGYEEWLRADSGDQNESFTTSTMDEWNQQFEERMRRRKPVEQTKLMLLPDEMAYDTHHIGSSIIEHKEATFTSQGGSRPEYTDLRSAYTTEHTIIDKIPVYEPVSKTLEELIAERNKVYELDKDKDLEAIHAYELKKQQEEKEHLERIAAHFKGSSVSQWALRNREKNETIEDPFVKDL
jgi:curved DNA-binding protein CbpA